MSTFIFSNANLKDTLLINGLNTRIYRFGVSRRGLLVKWIGDIRDAKDIVVSAVSWDGDDSPLNYKHMESSPLFDTASPRCTVSTTEEANEILDEAAVVYGGEREAVGCAQHKALKRPADEISDRVAAIAEATNMKVEDTGEADSPLILFRDRDANETDEVFINRVWKGVNKHITSCGASVMPKTLLLLDALSSGRACAAEAENLLIAANMKTDTMDEIVEHFMEKVRSDEIAKALFGALVEKAVRPLADKIEGMADLIKAQQDCIAWWFQAQTK